MQTRKHAAIVRGAVIGTAMLATTAQAGGLGIPMDGFITQFTDTVVGLGYPIGLLGLAGWAGAHLNNTFGSLIGGSINLFATAGLLGGGAAIMGTLGLAAGGLLP
jgi:hypothetical protein